MEISNVYLVDPTFNSAFSRLLKKELPAKSALSLYKCAKVIQEHTQDILKVRNDLLLRHAQKDEDNKPKFVNNMPEWEGHENEEIFLQEMNDVLQETFELPIKNKVKLPENCVISPEDVLVLEPILDIE